MRRNEPGRVSTDLCARRASEIYRKAPLTDAEIERVRSDVPDDPIRLQSGFLACRACGMPVVRTSDLGEEIHLESRGRDIDGPAALTEAASNQRPIPLVFALCPEHRRTAELTEQLVADPSRRELLGYALDALRFCDASKIEQLAVVGLDLDGQATLVRYLANLGRESRWVSRFIPTIEVGAHPETCCRYGWAHLGIGLRQRLRQAYGRLLKERAARNASPVKVPPPRIGDLMAASSLLVPIDGGCLICGVGQQSAPAVTVAREGLQNVTRDLWTPVQTGTTALGMSSPQRLSGHLCRTCSDAVKHTGSMGPTAISPLLC